MNILDVSDINRKDLKYLCFSLDMNEAEAVEVFVKRYGYQPARTIRWANLLWVGPIKPESLITAVSSANKPKIISEKPAQLSFRDIRK